MNCRRVSHLISAYIDGELTGAEMLEVRKHIGVCRECAEDYESVRRTKFMLSRLSTAKPRPDLGARILSRLDEVTVPVYLRLWNRLVSYGRAHLTPITVGCAALGIVLVVLVSKPFATADIASGRASFYSEMMGLPSINITAPISYEPPVHARPLVFARSDNPSGVVEPSMLTFASFEAP